MPRFKIKDSEARSFRLRKDICERLDLFSEKSMIPKTKIVELALDEYLRRELENGGKRIKR